MKIGDKVRIVKCDVCPKVVDKVGTITELIEDDEGACFKIKFGKGRPQLNRPSVFAYEDLISVEGAE